MLSIRPLRAVDARAHQCIPILVHLRANSVIWAGGSSTGADIYQRDSACISLLRTRTRNSVLGPARPNIMAGLQRSTSTASASLIEQKYSTSHPLYVT